jgi:hypothetical protein
MANVRAIEIPESVKVYLYAGASGAKGTADPAGLPVDYGTTYGTTVDLTGAQAGVPWGFNFDSPSLSEDVDSYTLRPRATEHGWDIVVGAELDAMPGHSTALLGYARVGSTLGGNWISPGTIGSNSRTFFTTQRALLAADHTVAGMIWNTNNGDASVEALANAYAANMVTMAADMRALSGCSAMRIYLIRAHVDGDGAYTATVRTQQNAFAASDGNTTIIDQDSCELDAGDIHLTQAGLITLGGLLFDAIRDHEFHP